MKRDKNIYFLAFAFLLVILVFYSCAENTDEVKTVLAKTESMMNDHPDSALFLLNTIEAPESLQEPLYYEYITLLVQAKNKNQQDITNDTIIHDAANYFLKTNNPQKAATALFYWGRLNFYKEQYKIAISILLKADELAKKENDFYLLGLINDDIGTIYNKQLNNDKCLEHYYLSKNYFAKADMNKWEYNMLDRIASIYLYMDPPQVDKAIGLYQESLDFARSEKDTSQMIYHLNNIAIAYTVNKEFIKAKRAVLESMALDTNKELFNKQTVILSKVHVATGQIDSAIILLNTLTDYVGNMNNFELHSYYDALHEANKEKNNLQAALDYHEKMMDVYIEIMEENEAEAILEIQSKYEYEKATNLYQQTVIKKQQIELILSLFAVAMLLLAIIMFALFQRNKNRRRVAEEKTDAIESLLESEKVAVEQVRSKADKATYLLKKKLIEELNITKKVAYLQSVKEGKSLQKEYEKMAHEKIGKALEWDQIYKLIDELHPGFRSRLDEELSQLTEKEKRMCYLMKTRFNLSEIAYIMGYSQESVRSMKNKLRIKANFNTSQDLVDFLDSLVAPDDYLIGY